MANLDIAIKQIDEEIEKLGQSLVHAEDGKAILELLKTATLDNKEGMLESMAAEWLMTPTSHDVDTIDCALFDIEHNAVGKVSFTRPQLCALLIIEPLRERLIDALALHIIRYGTAKRIRVQ